MKHNYIVLGALTAYIIAIIYTDKNDLNDDSDSDLFFDELDVFSGYGSDLIDYDDDVDDDDLS